MLQYDVIWKEESKINLKEKLKLYLSLFSRKFCYI